jgi:hypothetical protein
MEILQRKDYFGKPTSTSEKTDYHLESKKSQSKSDGDNEITLWLIKLSGAIALLTTLLIAVFLLLCYLFG